MTEPTEETQPRGPWNPGIESELPRRFLPLATLFRPENVTTSVANAVELADITGLPAHELTRLRPSRLVVHELLIRVMADLSVADGARYEDLGINFRRMCRTLLDSYIAPHMPEVEAAHEALLTRMRPLVAAEVEALFPPPPAPRPPERKGLFGFLKGKSAQEPTGRSESAEEREARVLASWHARAQERGEPEQRVMFAGLSRIAGSMHRRRGRIVGGKELLTELVLTYIGNEQGSEIAGKLIEPLIADGVAREGYRPLPPQDHPVVMNVKGASAAGKSTMRPAQRRLADKLGVRWDEFALISPDIWRKFLLDYDSIGPAYGYAGTLTGHEVAIIDRKLDRYMARKGESGRMSHLLIDRFRFDSFGSGPDREDGSRLLTRFGHIVYMYFVVTPPEATVERAYLRGVQFGRYKAVDDLLDHNVEAFNGMPRLFFTWAKRAEKELHFEFLDNSVPIGTVPRTIAFGRNGVLNILDVGRMIDIDRFAKVNINALAPEDVYPGGDAMTPENNTHFLRECARQIKILHFVSFDTARIYARVEDGKLVWWDLDELRRAATDHETRAGLEAVFGKLPDTPGPEPMPPATLKHVPGQSLGRWGMPKDQPEPALATGTSD